MRSSLPGRAALALTPITIAPDQDRIEITTLGEAYEGRGDNLQVETAPGSDGMTARMSVRATTPGTSPNWIVFALRNATDKPMERWLTADRYNVVGSGTVWPDLDARRIEAVTPSVGFLPDRVKSDRADVFRLTIEPGQTITYVAELASDRFARLHLWKSLEYEQKIARPSALQWHYARHHRPSGGVSDRRVRRQPQDHFPSRRARDVVRAGLLCVDFGFWHKLFQMRPEENAQYRAAAEAAVAASLVIFLSLSCAWTCGTGSSRMLFAVWIMAQLALVAMAVLDPRLAATVCAPRYLSSALSARLLTLFLAMRGQDRALAILPTWILFLVWLFGAGVTVTGRLAGDIVVFGLLAGLVLIVV